MGLGDFLSGVKDAAVNVGKGAAWVANPEHYDDIAKGVGKGAAYVAGHPGKVWDTGFEVGREMLKEQLKPQNLAITAGLAALTVATAGAAAPALAAEVGGEVALGTKIAATTATAVKAAETVGTAAEGAEAVAGTIKGAETVGTALKAGETVADAAQVGEKASRLSSFGQDIRGTVQGIKEAKGLEKVDKTLGAVNELKGAARESLGLSRYGTMATQRAALAEKIGTTAGEDAGFGEKALAAGRNFAAKKTAGLGNSAVKEGSDLYSEVDKMKYRYNQVKALTQGSPSDKLSKITRDVNYAADPKKAAEDAVTKELTRRGVGQGTGYNVDRSQVSESLYGNGGAGGTPPPVGPGTVAGATEPGGNGLSSLSQSSQLQETLKAPKNKGGWRPQQHFWEGPGREAFGGISPAHDWRQMQPLRKIEAPSVRQAGKYSAYKQQKSAYDAQQTGFNQGDDLNDQGAPVDFAPEVPKSGMYALSKGQQPPGSATPGQLNSGPGPARPMGGRGRPMYATVRKPGETPFGAVGPVKKPNDVLDVDSYSPEDYGTNSSGQGYFKFPELGQPSSPMYQQGSRTSRRTNQLALGTGS